MAIFKSLFQKRAPAPPRLRSGMRVEVLNPEGVRIFPGRLRVLEDGILEVRMEEAELPPPPPVYNQEVKIRAVQENGGSFTLNGNVLASGLRVWRIERWKPVPPPPNLRDAFRQNTGIEGRLRTPAGQTLPCKVQDVSAVGAQVITSKLFQLEAALRLEITLLPDEPPFSLNCQVKRIQVQSRPGSFSKKYLYGCQFFEVPPREQERLLRVIFALERNTYRYREETL